MPCTRTNTHTYAHVFQAFSHSLHSWNQANAIRRSTAPCCERPSLKQVQLVNQLDEVVLQNYKNLVFTTRTLISWLVGRGVVCLVTAVRCV